MSKPTARYAASNAISRRTFEAAVHASGAVHGITILDVTDGLVFTTWNVLQPTMEACEAFFLRQTAEATRA